MSRSSIRSKVRRVGAGFLFCKWELATTAGLLAGSVILAHNADSIPDWFPGSKPEQEAERVESANLDDNVPQSQLSFTRPEPH